MMLISSLNKSDIDRFYLASENEIITFLTNVENTGKFYEQIPLFIADNSILLIIYKLF